MLSWKLPFMQSQGKCSKEFNLLMLCKWFEEVVVVSNELLISPPSFPCPSLLCVCSLLYYRFTGNLSSNAVSHEVISLGRGRIWKWFEICNLQKVQKCLLGICHFCPCPLRKHLQLHHVLLWTIDCMIWAQQHEKIGLFSSCLDSNWQLDCFLPVCWSWIFEANLLLSYCPSLIEHSLVVSRIPL